MGRDFDDDENTGSKSITRIEDMLSQAEQMVQQVNQLYVQFQMGVERLPPRVRRKQLDELVASLAMQGKTSQAAQFRFRNLQATYQAYAERWDRMVRKVETGEIKRPAGPKK